MVAMKVTANRNFQTMLRNHPIDHLASRTWIYRWRQVNGVATELGRVLDEVTNVARRSVIFGRLCQHRKTATFMNHLSRVFKTQAIKFEIGFLAFLDVFIK